MNLCYYEDEWAADALTALTSEAAYYEGQEYGLTDPRPGKTHPDKPGTTLIVRFAMEKDRKVKGARNLSRYYLLHGEPEERRPYAKSEFWQDDKDLFPEIGEDLFPDRVPGGAGPKTDDEPAKREDKDRRSRRRRDRRDDRDNGGDLFPDRDLGGRLDVRERERSRSPARRRRDDERDPFARGSQSGTWTKGELLKTQGLRERISRSSRSRSRSPGRRRRGRRTAADHF